uniref:Tachykinin-like peptide receptor 99D n=1 Tax=Polyphagotarsonemus latus TaxID=1204166 RepID=A0AAN0LPN2_9ACAR
MLALLNDSIMSNSTILSLKNLEENLDNKIQVNLQDSYSRELWQVIFWSFIFGFMVIIATTGNLIVIMIVLLNKQMRTITNLFIVNLSIADIMVSTMNVIFNFVYMLNGYWWFGSTYCKVSNFIAIMSVAASVFTLMAISIDRYIAIVYPLKPRMSLMTTLNIAIGIWCASSLLSAPNFIFSITQQETLPNGEIKIICLIKWPDGVAPGSKFDYFYNLAVLILTYFIPITLMALTYFRVGTVLWGSQTIGEYTAKQVQSIQSKRKIVKMLILVLCIFAVCWLPYHIYFIIQHHLPEITNFKYAQQIYLVLYWLAMSNSMYNPFIYCWMNNRFRRGFRNILFCKYCFKTNPSNNKKFRIRILKENDQIYLNEFQNSEQQPSNEQRNSTWYESFNKKQTNKLTNTSQNSNFFSGQKNDLKSSSNASTSKDISPNISDKMMMYIDNKSNIKICMASDVKNDNVNTLKNKLSVQKKEYTDSSIENSILKVKQPNKIEMNEVDLVKTIYKKENIIIKKHVIKKNLDDENANQNGEENCTKN